MPSCALPTQDGRIKPDLSAPGHPIHSTRSDAAPYSWQCSRIPALDQARRLVEKAREETAG